jgi:hypothetical protein
VTSDPDEYSKKEENEHTDGGSSDGVGSHYPTVSFSHNGPEVYSKNCQVNH